MQATPGAEDGGHVAVAGGSGGYRRHAVEGGRMEVAPLKTERRESSRGGAMGEVGDVDCGPCRRAEA